MFIPSFEKPRFTEREKWKKVAHNICRHDHLVINIIMADSFRFSRLYPLLWLFCYCFVCAMTSIIHKRTPTDEDKDVRVKKVGKVLHHNHFFDNRIVSFPQNREHKKHCHFSNLKWLNYALPPFRLNHWIRSTILNL